MVSISCWKLLDNICTEFLFIASVYLITNFCVIVFISFITHFWPCCLRVLCESPWACNRNDLVDQGLCTLFVSWSSNIIAIVLKIHRCHSAIDRSHVSVIKRDEKIFQIEHCKASSECKSKKTHNYEKANLEQRSLYFENHTWAKQATASILLEFWFIILNLLSFCYHLFTFLHLRFLLKLTKCDKYFFQSWTSDDVIFNSIFLTVIVHLFGKNAESFRNIVW